MNFKQSYNSGQGILAVIMWGVGISSTIFAGSYALISSRFADVNKTTINHESRISVIEERTKRIEIIESKLDKLLEKQGIKYYDKTLSADK